MNQPMYGTSAWDVVMKAGCKCNGCGFSGWIDLKPMTDFWSQTKFMPSSKDGAITCPNCGSYDVEGTAPLTAWAVNVIQEALADAPPLSQGPQRVLHGFAHCGIRYCDGTGCRRRKFIL